MSTENIQYYSCATKENLHSSANHKEKYYTNFPVFDVNKKNIAAFSFSIINVCLILYP
jgi:hypothetical protein